MELKYVLIIASEGPRRAASVQQVNRQQSMRKGGGGGKAENGVGNQGRREAVVTGAEVRGIGRETALVLARRGAVVWCK